MASAIKFNEFPRWQMCQKCGQYECDTYIEDYFNVDTVTDDTASLVRKRNHRCYTVKSPTDIDHFLYGMDKLNGFVVTMRTYLCESCIAEYLHQLKNPVHISNE